MTVARNYTSKRSRHFWDAVDEGAARYMALPEDQRGVLPRVRADAGKDLTNDDKWFLGLSGIWDLAIDTLEHHKKTCLSSEDKKVVQKCVSLVKKAKKVWQRENK
jgi:hypothetical protein